MNPGSSRPAADANSQGSVTVGVDAATERAVASYRSLNKTLIAMTKCMDASSAIVARKVGEGRITQSEAEQIQAVHARALLVIDEPLAAAAAETTQTVAAEQDHGTSPSPSSATKGATKYTATVASTKYSDGSGRKGRGGAAGTRNGPNVIYVVQVISSTGAAWTLQKTFEQFEELQQELKQQRVEMDAEFPRHRHMGHQNEAGNVAEQRDAFDAVLRELVDMRQLVSGEWVASFLEVTQHEAEHQVAEVEAERLRTVAVAKLKAEQEAAATMKAAEEEAGKLPLHV